MVIYLQVAMSTELLIKYGKYFIANGGHFGPNIPAYITSLNLISFGANKLRFRLPTLGSIGSMINIS